MPSDVAIPVPFRLRVGVTGHRHLPSGIDWFTRTVEALEVVEQQLGPTGQTPIRFTVVSSLAEGADRIVARALLESREADLEAVLPLPIGEYLEDFETEESRREFRDLLKRAVCVRPASRQSTREIAWLARDLPYKRAGQEMVGRSDVVIAMWDGQAARGPGGTAEIIQFARDHGRAVAHIDTASTNPVEMLLPERSPSTRRLPRLRRRAPDPFAELRSALRGVELYNRAAHSQSRIDIATAKARSELMSEIEKSERAAEMWKPVAAWVVPHYVRADLLALGAQRWSKRLTHLVYVLPVAAIATVAVQTQFAPRHPGLLWIEMGILLGVLLLVGIDHRLRPHQRWISYRHLAERLRGAFFLAVVEPPPAGRSSMLDDSGMSDAAYVEEEREDLRLLSGESRILGFHDSSEGWLPRIFAEIWRGRPGPEATEDDLSVLRRVLANQWVGGQARYHDKAMKIQRTRYLAIETSCVALFAATVAVATFHAADASALSSTGVHILDVMAIVLPALAAALTALARQHEYRRNHERSATIATRLKDAQSILASATSLSELRTDAETVEGLMIDENRDWFGLMRTRQLEPRA